MSSPSGLWYKSPWVWFIIFLLASAVTASLYTVYLVQGLPNDVLPQKVNKFAMEEVDADSAGSEEASEDTDNVQAE